MHAWESVVIYILYEQKETIFKGLWPFCMIKINLALRNLVVLHDKKGRGLVAIIQIQNDPFFNTLWPFCMIKINLALINLVILHLYRTKRTKFCYTMSIDFK